MAVDRYLYRKRRLLNVVCLTLAMFATLFGLFWLVWLLWTLVAQGLQYTNWDLFTEATPPPGDRGGLSNAIAGSAILTALGVLIGAPLGVLAGTYLSEFGRGTRFATLTRFISDVLLSSPSIILGVFVYELVVLRAGHFSAYAGGLALALVVLPIVVRTTEDMLRLVPDRMREAAAALGAPRWKVVVSIVYRAARSGILTGILLAIARVSGETAPLLFTALNNQFASTRLDQPIANLPVVIFQFAMSPYDDWQHLAWAGALLITFAILLLNIIVRVFLPAAERRH